MFDFIAKIEIAVHKVFCQVGIHEFRRNDVLTGINKMAFPSEDVVTSSCFYCSKNIHKGWHG